MNPLKLILEKILVIFQQYFHFFENPTSMPSVHISLHSHYHVQYITICGYSISNFLIKNLRYGSNFTALEFNGLRTFGIFGLLKINFFPL